MSTVLENYQQVKLAGYKRRLLGRGLERGVRTLTPHQTPASILAHEYGHAKTLLGATPMKRKLRMLGYSYGSPAAGLYNLSRLGQMSGKPGEKALRLGLTQAAGEAPKLVEEFLASYHGLKALKKFRRISPKAYKRARNDLVLAYSTYLSGAAGNVGISAAMPFIESKKGLDKLKALNKLLGFRLLAGAAPFAAVGVMHGTRKSTPTLGRLGRMQLAKSMGQLGTTNLQPRYGGRSALGAFFLHPQKIPMSSRRQLGEIYGRGNIEKVLRKGGVSVPVMTPGELGRGKNYQDKLLGTARKMQKRTLWESLTGK